MYTPSIAVIGYGIVGQRVYKTLANFKPDIYDKYKEIIIKNSPDVDSDDNVHTYDFAFICVDTPLKNDGMSLDTSEVCSAIHDYSASVYVIKSTCPVGFTDTISRFTHKEVVYSPEYYGNTQHCNNFEFDFTIIGGRYSGCQKVQQLLQHCYDARHTFRIVDSDTAELAKLMENAWIATKV